MKKTSKQPKLLAIVTPLASKTAPSHHIRLTPELQAWAEQKAETYRSVAAWIVELVRTAYQQARTEAQAEIERQRKAA